ncbi:MAG TPA: hypothetical protein VJ044_01395 [Candidatus Hodarchaeales archaeon]|nr:hypothetical protein [Candidatus Hodarchaeales archaeon]
MPKSLTFSSRINETGVDIRFNNNVYPISYPDKVWSDTPTDLRRALRDNLALATTIHLPLVFKAEMAKYDTGRPYLEPYFFLNFLRDLPSCAVVDGSSSEEMVRSFIQTQYLFDDPEVCFPSLEAPKDAEKAIISLSFGKDSLLSYGVAEEIGLEPEMVYIIERSMKYEFKHKRELGLKFEKEFGKRLHTIMHETSLLRDYDHLKMPFSDLGWGLQSTEYALELLPLSYSLGGKYILFGNEQSTASNYLDNEKNWNIYPSFDQSPEWTKHIDQATLAFSGRGVNTASLIEPLMDILVQRILIKRYPQYAKYQNSCFTRSEQGKDYRWCHSCGICAEMYLLSVAFANADPGLIGFRENMFDKAKIPLFAVFDNPVESYRDSPLGRDSDVFCLYLASRNGVSGAVIDAFRQSDLYEEARSREDEFYKKFFTLYDPITIPSELRKPTLTIYREEIENLEL